MTEYVEKELLYKRLLEKSNDEKSCVYLGNLFIYALRDVFSELPTADVVEVVRCKDCKWWTKQTDSKQGRCALSGNYPTGYWYCANGERRVEE